MKQENSFDSILLGQENPEEITKLLKYAQKGKYSAIWKRVLLSMVMVCLLGGVGGFAVFKIAHPWELQLVEVEGKRGETMPLADYGIMPRWEERTIYEQYATLEWNDKKYYAKDVAVSAERIGAFLGEAQAYGQDYYAGDGEDIRTIGAKVYAVTELSSECIVAVQYEGTDTWYAFKYALHLPETMGELIEDMNLYEDVCFGGASYSYVNYFGQYISVHFEDVVQEKIHQWLFSSPEAENTFDQGRPHLKPEKIMEISVDIPVLGVENIALEVCEEGYIWTNIIDTGGLFYVGEENTQAFIEYVLNECHGYEKVYVYDDSGMLESLFGREFGGETLSGLLEKLFERKSEESSPSRAPQSSGAYNPGGAASPSRPAAD